MVSIFCRIAVIAVLLLLPVSALGAWRAVDGIDVGTGKPSLLMIGDLDERTSLYARCVDGHAELFLDGFDGGDFDIAPVGPVNLIITTDTGKTWSSEARYGREKSGYITTTWLTRETISAAVAELAAAKSAISISIEFAESGDASVWDTDAKGSTAAGRRFLEACPRTSFAGLPVPPADPVPEQLAVPEPVQEPMPAPEPEPSLPMANWQLDSSGPTYRLSGQLDSDHVLTFNCDASAAIVLIHRDGLDVQPPAGKTLLLSIAVDNGERWNVPVGMVRMAPGYLAFSQIAQDLSHIQFMDDLLEAQSRIDVWLDDPESGLGLSWSVSSAGIPSLALEYFSVCLPVAPMDKLTPEEAPAPVPTGWRFEEFPDGQGGTQTSLSTRNAADDGRFLLTCEGDKTLSLTYVSEDMGSLQISGDSVPARVRIDRASYALSLGVATQLEDFGVLISFDAEEVTAIVRALAEGPSAVSVAFPILATGELYERQFATDNLAAAAGQFLAGCFDE